jgi:putative transposase
MLIIKAFHYRLYPTKEPQRFLTRRLEECRWRWNTLLAARKQAWEQRQETVEYYEQKAELPGLKARERPSLAEVHSQVLQDVVLRLKNAFDAFFRRLNAGETPGYPRFRGKGRYDRLTFAQVPVGCALDAHAKRVVVSKVGRIKVLLHRPLEGAPKTATIRRTATGKWFVTFSCEWESTEWEPTPLPPTGHEVGIDVGLKVFAMPTTSDPIENPRFFRAEERALARAQRKHQVILDAHTAVRSALTTQITQLYPDLDARQVWPAVSQDDSERTAWRKRQRQRCVVARVHERIRARRSDFTHQQSRRLVNTVDFLAVEDLSVRNMMANHQLPKSIHDAAWTAFAALIACKAAWAGRQAVAMHPASTRQDCSGCGHRKSDLTLDDRHRHRHRHLLLRPRRPGDGPRPQCGAHHPGARTRAGGRNGIGTTMPGFALEAPALRHGESSRDTVEAPREGCRHVEPVIPGGRGALR